MYHMLKGNRFFSCSFLFRQEKIEIVEILLCIVGQLTNSNLKELKIAEILFLNFMHKLKII